MIPRYSRENIVELWSEESKFRLWYKIERIVLHETCIFYKIPSPNLPECIDIDVDQIHEIERCTQHDVIAFLTYISQQCQVDTSYLHFGMTSSDLLDTAFSYQLRHSAILLIEDIHNVLQSLKALALKYKYDFCIGRSHGIHAEPVTLGLKFARFYAEFNRALTRMKIAMDEISVCAISGPVGTYASIHPRIQRNVANALDLKSESISSQIIPRDRHAMFFSILGIIASSIENISIEFRHLQRTEIGEIEENFSIGQKGSSAMPHKKNPVLSENLTGLARVIRSSVIPALENVALWHERDISHSSVERFIAPSTCITLDFALYRLNGILKNIHINTDKALHNIETSRGMYASHQILLHLITNQSLSRENAYKIVQDCSMLVHSNQSLTMRSILMQQKIITDEKILDQIFDLRNYTQHIDYIFESVFN